MPSCRSPTNRLSCTGPSALSSRWRTTRRWASAARGRDRRCRCRRRRSAPGSTASRPRAPARIGRGAFSHGRPLASGGTFGGGRCRTSALPALAPPDSGCGHAHEVTQGGDDGSPRRRLAGSVGERSCGSRATAARRRHEPKRQPGVARKPEAGLREPRAARGDQNEPAIGCGRADPSLDEPSRGHDDVGTRERAASSGASARPESLCEPKARRRRRPKRRLLRRCRHRCQGQLGCENLGVRRSGPLEHRQLEALRQQPRDAHQSGVGRQKRRCHGQRRWPGPARCRLAGRRPASARARRR